jgi:hypothetical protein
MWDLTGKIVEGNYLGEFPIRGQVLNSRVKYGGKVQHTIESITPVEIPWTAVGGDFRTIFLVDCDQITRVVE